MKGMVFQATGSKLPSFLCVGAQKAGTTTLHSLLGHHPSIYLPQRKELHYFTLHYNQGLKWYEEFFSPSDLCQVRGEITPYYLFHPYSAQRIAHDLGQVKIIILLRDPVVRTLSHYSHALRLGFEDLTLEQALEAEKSRLEGSELVLKKHDGRHQYHQECSYLSRSLYRDQVERYWKYFGKNNVIILPSELMFDDAWGSLTKIFKFLGVSSFIKPNKRTLNVRKNKGNTTVPYIDASLVDKLKSELQDSYQFARYDLGWDDTCLWQWFD